MITIGREICLDLDKALTYEWLVTNGRGSYASSTITGARTRRYHGLLVAALEPPLKRTLLLAKIDEEVQVGGQTYRLGTNEYPAGTVEPNGFLFLQSVTIEGTIPSFYFGAANFKLTKTIWMEHGRDTTFIRYELDRDSSPVGLTLLPYCAFRDFHSLTNGSLDSSYTAVAIDGGFRLKALEVARSLEVRIFPSATFTPLGLWYWRFQLRKERERGLDSSEDLYLPGLLRTDLGPGQCITVAVTLEAKEPVDLDPEDAWVRVLKRQADLVKGGADEFERELLAAADQFLVQRPTSKLPVSEVANGTSAPASIIAGYHWFGDLGRDTLISLEGLTLAAGRPEVAKQVLLAYAQFFSDGLMPTGLPDSSEKLEYDSADGGLWYFHALDKYFQVTRDRQLLRDLFPLLQDVVECYINSSPHNIHMDHSDGLISLGTPGSQLTWMDAKTLNGAMEPRSGKPVETNALWFNALNLLQAWSKDLGESGTNHTRLIDQVAASFERYWFTSGGYLYDVIDGALGDDASLRPNQLFALSLSYSPVPNTHAKSMLEVISRELLTPLGLRTLTPRHPSYQGRFKGNQASRDSAYHNGAVWPWLVGPYLDACRRVFPEQTTPLSFFEPFQVHLSEAGVGSIGECFEGDPPHRPVACIAMAWSVGEILRTYRRAKQESMEISE